MNIERMMDAAKAAALAGPGAGGRNRKAYRLGAAVFRRNRLLSARHNSYKTSPRCLRHSEFPFMHAEMAAIFAAGTENCDGASLFVARVLRNGESAIAAPCPACLECAKESGIKRIYYTLSDNRIEECKL